MEYKSIPYFTKGIDGRTVTGIFAVHGNVDEGGDRSVNGSFGKRFGMGRKRVRFLWSHNGYNPPIATINQIREVEREELPEKVLTWAAEATGGVEVTRTYYEGVPLADWVLKSIQAGDMEEMSFAYDIHESEMVDGVRELRDVELFDISDVNWGMNPATAGVKGLPVPGMTLTQHSALVVATVQEWLERVKDRREFRTSEGRRLSEETEHQLQMVTDAMLKVIEINRPLASQEDVYAVLAEYWMMEARLAGNLK